MKVFAVIAVALFSALPAQAFYGNHLEACNAYLETREAHLEAREAYADALGQFYDLQVRGAYPEAFPGQAASKIKEKIKDSCTVCLVDCKSKTTKGYKPVGGSCRAACESFGKC